MQPFMMQPISSNVVPPSVQQQQKQQQQQQQQQQLYGIHTPHDNDVLCGRGVTTNRHVGNRTFRNLVNRNKELYVSSTKKGKMTISRSIVESIRTQQNPPGRFLEKDPSTQLWYDIGDKKAVEKTSQALRDGAAVLRKQLSEDLSHPDFLSAVFDETDKGSRKQTKSDNISFALHRRTVSGDHFVARELDKSCRKLDDSSFLSLFDNFSEEPEENKGDSTRMLFGRNPSQSNADGRHRRNYSTPNPSVSRSEGGGSPTVPEEHPCVPPVDFDVNNFSYSHKGSENCRAEHDEQLPNCPINNSDRRNCLIVDASIQEPLPGENCISLGIAPSDVMNSDLRTSFLMSAEDGEALQRLLDDLPSEPKSYKRPRHDRIASNPCFLSQSIVSVMDTKLKAPRNLGMEATRAVESKLMMARSASNPFMHSVRNSPSKASMSLSGFTRNGRGCMSSPRLGIPNATEWDFSNRVSSPKSSPRLGMPNASNWDFTNNESCSIPAVVSSSSVGRGINNRTSWSFPTKARPNSKSSPHHELLETTSPSLFSAVSCRSILPVSPIGSEAGSGIPEDGFDSNLSQVTSPTFDVV